MTRCQSCKGALPGGCSVCRPMPMKVGRVTFESPGVTAHTCPQCMRGLPCPPVDTSSLSALVGAATHFRTADDWKRDTFPQETQ